MVDEQARALLTAVDEHLPGWVVSCVARHDRDPEVLARAEAAGLSARDEVLPRLQALLDADIDAQGSTPLSILRSAVRFPADVLKEGGVVPVARDSFSVERFPDDDYDLTPATFADVHPEVGEAGLRWGAAKAMAHKARHGGSL